MRESFDVIVIGLGGMGSAAAAELAGRGQRVLGLERFGPAHDRGSSHGETRIIRQAYFEDPAYVPLLLQAYRQWVALEGETGAQLLTETGGLMIGRPDSATVAGSLRSARTWQLDHELLNAAETAARWPTFRLAPDEMALFEPRAGYVRPEATVAACLELARRRGATLRFGAAVERWGPSGEGVVVSAADGDVAADRLVITAGAWSSTLVPMGLPMVVERHVAHWFSPPGGLGPFGPRRHPVFIWDPADAPQFYGLPAVGGDGDGVKVAFFRQGTPASPDRLERVVAPGADAALRRALVGRIPDLDGPVVCSVPCMYTVTPDEHFVIGAYPGLPQVVLAAGFSGHGFKFVPVVGQILADLATEGVTGHDIGLFDPTRFAWPGAGRATPRTGGTGK